MACNRQYFLLLNLPLHTGLGQSFDSMDIWRTKNGSDLGSACFLLDSACFWISPGFSLYHMFPCISKKQKWFFSSCWHSFMDTLISMQPLGEGTKAGGWFNWSDKIIAGKCLKLLPYLWGYMQSSLMRERTRWFLISPFQTISWTWLNIWLIQLPHLPHQIFMFTKTNQTHCFITPPAISPDSSFTCTAETANGKKTWEHELETHQHCQVWKWLLGTKNSQITCACTVFPTHLSLIQLIVICFCQDCPRFITGLSKRLISSQSNARWMGWEVRRHILGNMSSPLRGSGAPNLVWLYQLDLFCGTVEPDDPVEK